MTEGAEARAGLAAAAEAIRANVAAREPRVRGAELAGIGWGTVELERAARELGAELGIDSGAWVPTPRDALLGARGWSALAPAGEGPAIVLLEPDTEGRLAATLVRFAEGVAALYLRRPVAGAPAPVLASSEVRESPLAQSALGPARVVLGGPAWGPHVLLLEPPEDAPRVRATTTAPDAGRHRAAAGRRLSVAG